MSAIHPNKRTRDMMAAGAPGEWKHKPLTIPAREVRPPREVDPRFKANPARKPASTGPKPPAPAIIHPREAVRNLVRQGVDQANAGDVFGHNERERAELPNRALTPNRTFRPQEKAPRRKPGFAAIGALGVQGAHVRKKAKKSVPKKRKGYVYDLPDRLKKYASA